MKKRMRRVIALVLTYLMALNAPLFAWGSVGHMAVAYVAFQKLTPATRSRVRALLKLNPDYQKWLGKIPAGTAAKFRSMMVFMIAATWPDQIKSETGYTDDGPDPHGDLPDGATSSQNIGYSDHLHHKYWHFVDKPFSQDGSPLPAVPTPDAETQIAAFRTVLGTNSPGDVKSYDLVWLLHLVGDVHQPLHSSTRVSSTDPAGDRGGNSVALCAAPCRHELHGFWDALPGTGSNPNTAVTYAKKLPAVDATLGNDLDAATWIKESFDDAQTIVYVAPIGAGDGPFTTTPAYRSAARTVAKERVALAGVRLANLLNAELK
jgi:S1/P1 Nuclease